MKPLQLTSQHPICDEMMIPAISSAPSPALHRKHVKERGTKGELNTEEEVKVHTSRIRRNTSSRRLCIHFLIVMGVIGWIGIQLYMLGSLAPEKPSFLPVVNQKESSFQLTQIVNDLATYVIEMLHFGSHEFEYKKSKQQQLEEDYVQIFYMLLCINFLIVLPSFCRRCVKKWSSIIKTDVSTNVRVENQSDQHQRSQRQTQQILTEEQMHRIHRKLLYQTYLPPYLLATAADWLQGPYKYALYSSYGYTQRDIAHLFVVGYGSGMVLGSIVGGLADEYGRKRLCLWYCVSYAVSVSCTHFKNYYVLLLGRCGGGVGTSLLFSVFESWLIGAHVDRGLIGGKGSGNGEKWLAESFSVGTYGSSLIAIVSGVLANFIVARNGKMRPFSSGEDESGPSLFVGGYIAAFDACWPILICCAALIMLLWDENYGEDHPSEDPENNQILKPRQHGSILDESTNESKLKPQKLDYNYLKKHSSIRNPNDDECLSGSDNNTSTLQEIESQSNGSSKAIDTNLYDHHTDGMFASLWNGMVTVWQSPTILMCCIIGSFFEGSMYIFIFLWTPALTSIQRTILSSEKVNTDEGTELISSSDPHGEVDELPFGWIFSSFMVCCMLGTISFSHLTNTGVSASMSLVWILALAALSCLAMAVPFAAQPNCMSGSHTVQYIGMLMYEFCIGAYYPCMGTVKGVLIPESQRAAIYNVFRLPLNLMVLLYLVGDFDTESSFLANAVLLAVACILQARIVKSSTHGHSN